MANNIIKRIWNQNKMVQIEDLKGMAFQAEDGGHTFEIYGIDEAGETVTLTGTPSGVFLRPDNTDVVLDCSVSDGVVSATLPDECYDVPGRGGLTVFITSDGKKTALYAAVVTVSRTSSGNVAPPATQTVVDLVNAISAAVATIPASYSALMADIAPTYSDSALYAVGQYAWYDGDLKRCIVPITTAESYTAAHWTSAVLGNDVSDLKSALNADVLNLNELLKFGTRMNFNFTEGCAINSSGAVFNDTSNAQKRMTTVDFIDISAARKTNNVPVADNGYNEKLTYSIESGYRVFVAFYETPSESSANKNIVGWVSGSGTLTPNYNYMRICMQTSSDATKVTKADAVNLTMSLYPTIESIIDKMNHWGLALKGYANTTSFDNNIDVGMYIIENPSHNSTANNPIAGSDGILLVVPASNYASVSPKLITGLIQIVMTNNGQIIYFRRVSGANTRTFGTWQKPLENERINIKKRINADADPGFTADSFESGGISESGGNVTNSKRIRTKGYVSLGIHNCIRYNIQSGYRAFFVPFTSNSGSYNKPGTGWLQNSGILYFSDDIKYYRFSLASVGDESSLTTADYNKISIELDYKLNDSFTNIVERTKWLALGDSITYGVYSTGAGVEVKASNGWVNQLAGSLGYVLNNMGEPGMGFVTTGNTGVYWSDKLDQVDALTDEYNLITVALGINDYNTSSVTLSQISDAIDTGIQRLMTKFPSARLVFITPFNSNRRGDADSNYCYNYEYGGRSLKDIADLIQDRCKHFGVECIYASNGFLLNNYNMGTLLPDQTHPSTYCHKLIAKNMAHFLLN